MVNNENRNILLGVIYWCVFPGPIYIFFVACGLGIAGYYLHHFMPLWMMLGISVLLAMAYYKSRETEILYSAVFLPALIVSYEIFELGYNGFFLDGFKTDHFLATLLTMFLGFAVSKAVMAMTGNSCGSGQVHSTTNRPVKVETSQLQEQHVEAAQNTPVHNISQVAFLEQQGKNPDPHAFEDIIGAEEAIEEIKDALELPLYYPEYVKAYKFKPPRGILLHGPPGTGKTSFARAAARYFGCTFFVVNASSMCSGRVGDTENNIIQLFENARRLAPSVIFFDEVDAIGKERDSKDLNRPSDLVINVLLSELDGFKQDTGVFVIAATNRVDILDEALTRPGRLEQHIYMGLPKRHERVELFELFLKDVPGHEYVDFEKLAFAADGYSPADIESACSYAVKTAMKRAVSGGNRNVMTEDVLTAIGGKK